MPQFWKFKGGYGPGAPPPLATPLPDEDVRKNTSKNTAKTVALAFDTANWASWNRYIQTMQNICTFYTADAPCVFYLKLNNAWLKVLLCYLSYLHAICCFQAFGDIFGIIANCAFLVCWLNFLNICLLTAENNNRLKIVRENEIGEFFPRFEINSDSENNMRDTFSSIYM